MYFHVLPIMEKYYWYVFIESQGMAAESIQWRNIEKKEKLGRVAHYCWLYWHCYRQVLFWYIDAIGMGTDNTNTVTGIGTDDYDNFHNQFWTISRSERAVLTIFPPT